MVNNMKCQEKQPINPWFYIFGVIAFAIGCILFGNSIRGQSTDPISTGFGNFLMSFGTTIMVALVLAAAIILGIAYLVYWLFFKPRNPDLY